MAKKETGSTLTYDLAYAELQEILRALQEEQIGIDELSDKVKRAGELIRFCRERLRKVEKELEDLAGD